MVSDLNCRPRGRPVGSDVSVSDLRTGFSRYQHPERSSLIQAGIFHTPPAQTVRHYRQIALRSHRFNHGPLATKSTPVGMVDESLPSCMIARLLGRLAWAFFTPDGAVEKLR